MEKPTLPKSGTIELTNHQKEISDAMAAMMVGVTHTLVAQIADQAAVVSRQVTEQAFETSANIVSPQIANTLARNIVSYFLEYEDIQKWWDGLDSRFHDDVLDETQAVIIDALRKTKQNEALDALHRS